MDELIILFILPIGYFLDLILGDPMWLPHPIVWFGKSIAFFEKQINKGNNRALKGVLVTLFLVGTCFILFFFGWRIIKEYNLWIYFGASILFIFYGLANRTLISEGKMVFSALKKGLDAGRKQVSRIVGRNTEKLDANQIKTAVLETLSENLSDGVIAPLFYFAIGGIPAMMTYKMINTLDSMIGYKTERYKQFGYFAAKLDDLANYIPARITSVLIALVSFSWRSLSFIFKFGKAHASPNAGYPEAALAGALNCQFGGKMQYADYISDKPTIGLNKREIHKLDLKRTIFINHMVCLISVIIIFLIHWQIQ